MVMRGVKERNGGAVRQAQLWSPGPSKVAGDNDAIIGPNPWKRVQYFTSRLKWKGSTRFKEPGSQKFRE